MYASPRYNTRYGSPTGGHRHQSSASGYSPTKSYASSSYDHQRHYSPPLKQSGYQQQHHHQARSYAEYYNSNQYQHQQHYQQTDGTHYYHQSHSGSSTASSSQDGYYGDDLDDLDDYSSYGSSSGSPEMTTVPTVPTSIQLSLYETGKTPSGRVLVTSGNQTVEFFSCVVNAPVGMSRGVYVAE